MGLLPLVIVLEQNGGANVVSTNMVAQLQANNLNFTQVDPEGCQFYFESLMAWITGIATGSQVNSPYVSELGKSMNHSL
jgi:hypothetical protein